MSEKATAADALPVKDQTAGDVKAIIEEKRILEKQLEQTQDALNATLAILTGLYLQPFVVKEYLGSDEIDHVNYTLTALLAPIAKVLAHGTNDNTIFTQALTRLVVMCFNYFVTVHRIVTPQSEVQYEGATYGIREENLIPYTVQKDPELPKTKYHDQPLKLLLEAMRKKQEASQVSTEPGDS